MGLKKAGWAKKPPLKANSTTAIKQPNEADKLMLTDEQSLLQRVAAN